MRWVDIVSLILLCIAGFALLCLLIYLLCEHIIWWKDKRKHDKYVKELGKIFIKGKLNLKKLNLDDIFDLLSLSFIKHNKKWCKILIKVYKYKIKKFLQGDK